MNFKEGIDHFQFFEAGLEDFDSRIIFVWLVCFTWLSFVAWLSKPSR